MKPPLSYLPALPAATGLCAGVVCHGFGISLYIIMICLVAFLILYAVRQHYLSFYFLFTAAGAMLALADETPPMPETASERHNVEATIIETAERGSVVTYTMEIHAIENIRIPPFKAVVTSRSVHPLLYPGTEVKFVSTFTSTYTPPIECDVPESTDYNKYLRAEGISAKAVIGIAPTAIKFPDGMRQVVNEVRVGIYNAIVDSPVSAQTASFLVATILGDRTLLSAETSDDFKETGVAHILALSGLHIGILACMLSWILLPVQAFRRGLTIKYIIVMIAVWGYAVLTGMGESIQRAAIMITVVILSRMLQRGNNVCNSLLLSVAIIIAINPLSLHSPGFQLSVVAVASVFAGSSLIPRKLQKRPLLWGILNFTIVPVAAMLGTGMLAAYYFNILPGLFLPGNIVAGLLFPWILGGGILLMIFTAIGIKAVALGVGVDLLYEYMYTAIRYFADLNGASHTIYFSGWVLLPYFATFIMLIMALHMRKWHFFATTLALALVTCTTYVLTRERHSGSELFITRDSECTTIIAKEGHKAFIFTDSEYPDFESQRCDIRYRRYLLSRGCGEKFIVAYNRKGIITLGGKRIYVVDKNPDYAQMRAPADYALISGKFLGSIVALRANTPVDTILLSAAIHHWRKKRMIRECGDTIPYRDIKSQGFALMSE